MEKSKYVQMQQSEAAKAASMLRTEAKQESTIEKGAENVAPGNPNVFKAKGYTSAGTALIVMGMFWATASVAVMGQLSPIAVAIDLSAIVVDGIASSALLHHGYQLFSSPKA